MKRASRWRRAPGWWWRFPAVCVLVGGFFVALMPAGWVLAHVSDWIGAVSQPAHRQTFPAPSRRRLRKSEDLTELPVSHKATQKPEMRPSQ